VQATPEQKAPRANPRAKPYLRQPGEGSAQPDGHAPHRQRPHLQGPLRRVPDELENEPGAGHARGRRGGLLVLVTRPGRRRGEDDLARRRRRGGPGLRRRLRPGLAVLRGRHGVLDHEADQQHLGERRDVVRRGRDRQRSDDRRVRRSRTPASTRACWRWQPAFRATTASSAARW